MQAASYVTTRSFSGPFKYNRFKWTLDIVATALLYASGAAYLYCSAAFRTRFLNFRDYSALLGENWQESQMEAPAQVAPVVDRRKKTF